MRFTENNTMRTRFTSPEGRRVSAPGITPPRPRVRGFTLIELMVTVAVVAVLMSIAAPNYSEYVTRGKLVDATSGLSDMRVRMEQYFADFRQYPSGCIAPGAGAAPAGKIYLPPASNYFSYNCTRLTATTYTVTATGQSSGGVGGFAYAIDESSNRRTVSLPNGWSGAGATSMCWVMRRNGSC